ncbi:unnamed protein product [Miscanthus lutarioriparius]|uniref:Uncharacterized protein n=1 Tax=Miscanthus lutarioriparius TaxID=422564 RepID=A0A811SEQ3_9POAL|nr:unnamed protein product [Miscanthus lutarioriparius]
MCLPFCCRENDPPQSQVTHEHHPGHGFGHTEPIDHPPPSGTGKEANNGNGASMNKNKSDDEGKNKTADSPPTPPPQSPEYTPAAPQAPPSPKHTAATKAPKKVEQVVASPIRHAGPVAAAGVAGSARTPPETQQIGRRGHAHEDDYGYPNPSASPTVVAVPAANNFRGDRGHGDAHHAHAYVGKDDRKTTGRTRQ